MVECCSHCGDFFSYVLLGYPVGNAQLVFLFGVGSNGVMLFDLWSSSSFLVSLGGC